MNTRSAIGHACPVVEIASGHSPDPASMDLRYETDSLGSKGHGWYLVLRKEHASGHQASTLDECSQMYLGA